MLIFCIVHSQYYGLPLDPIFSVLVECLHEASRRWLCSQELSSKPPLAAQLAAHLQLLHKSCLGNPKFTLKVVSSIESDGSWGTKDQSQDDIQRSQNPCGRNNPPEQPVPAAVAAFATSPPLGQPRTSSVGAPLAVPGTNYLSDKNGEHWTSSSDVPEPGVFDNSTGPPDELSNILQTFTDHNFAEMDRVISWDDFNFEAMPSHLTQIPPMQASSDWTPEIHGYVAGERRH